VRETAKISAEPGSDKRVQAHSKGAGLPQPNVEGTNSLCAGAAGAPATFESFEYIASPNSMTNMTDT
jgi:hypothetical protein